MASTLTKPLSFSHLLTSFLNPLTSLKPFSITATPTPLLYEAIIYRPRHAPRLASRHSPNPEPSFEDWADSKLTHSPDTDSDPEPEARRDMSRTERKYLRKRKKRLYGGDSDDERKRVMEKGEVVELVPEIVKFKSLHEREEELYFYDAFCFPWEKNKHYHMMYHLEKKFFPDYCLDKAFLKPGEAKFIPSPDPEDSRLVFFEKRRKPGTETGEEKEETETREEGKELSVRKVGEFFKDLKKGTGTGTGVGKSVKVVGVDVPFLASRSNGLPPKWDCLAGTAVLVNKPKGWTSFTVCGKLRRLVKVKKVGHAGTLDPMATGLLIVCVGKATKVVDSYQGMVKGYSGTFRLGEATSTWDADSPVIQREPWEHIKDRDIKKAVASFMGEIWQVPPMFSAIKVGGEKMYEKARRGESIELAPRQISIFQFDVERSLEDRQNLIFRVTCSKGTYIRSLCADLGKALGSCAHLTSLRRDSIGEYTADDAFEFHELEELIPKSYI